MLRRDFLRSSAGALAATLAPLSGCDTTSDPNLTLAEPTTLGAVADDATIGGIGRAYLASAPQESSRARLVRALLEDEPGDRASQEDPEALTNFLRAKIRADFQADRTVIVDGWVLAVTEARQAALFSLTR